MLRRRKELAKRLNKVGLFSSAFVLLVGAFAGATAAHPSPLWLTVLNVLFGLVNLALVPGADNLPIFTPVLLEASTGLITIATAYATYLGGARHYALASAQLFAGVLYLAASALHRKAVERRRAALDASPSPAQV